VVRRWVAVQKRLGSNPSWGRAGDQVTLNALENAVLLRVSSFTASLIDEDGHWLST